MFSVARISFKSVFCTTLFFCVTLISCIILVGVYGRQVVLKVLKCICNSLLDCNQVILIRGCDTKGSSIEGRNINRKRLVGV
jgi:hypothetical protein